MTDYMTMTHLVTTRTAEEWLAVYNNLVEIRKEIADRCEQARNAWDTHKTDELWEASRVVQREYEIASARVHVAYAFYVARTSGIDEDLLTSLE